MTFVWLCLMDLEEDFGRDNRFTISGIPNYEFVDFPTEKVTSPIFEEDDEHIVIRVSKSHIEKDVTAWFSWGIKKKDNEKNKQK